MTYEDAIEELEQLLQTLQSDTVDVDQMLAKTERAAELIRFCRKKLRDTEARLEDIWKEGE
ncbi:MAG: exodeoxyribonuclease VII small subunit [Bacteroidetes bacterium]|nr:MAG: exodeoxyribonuclease VII small subunit [Bacteroidota bacterium]